LYFISLMYSLPSFFCFFCAWCGTQSRHLYILAFRPKQLDIHYLLWFMVFLTYKKLSVLYFFHPFCFLFFHLFSSFFLFICFPSADSSTRFKHKDRREINVLTHVCGWQWEW
jgi:hypothetical protein